MEEQQVRLSSSDEARSVADIGRRSCADKMIPWASFLVHCIPWRVKLD